MGLHLSKDGSIDTSNFKIVYIAPMKALVAEMVGNFSTRLEPYGIKVRELTGDMNLTKAEIEATQVRPPLLGTYIFCLQTAKKLDGKLLVGSVLTT